MIPFTLRQSLEWEIIIVVVTTWTQRDDEERRASNYSFEGKVSPTATAQALLLPDKIQTERFGTLFMLLMLLAGWLSLSFCSIMDLCKKKPAHR